MSLVCIILYILVFINQFSQHYINVLNKQTKGELLMPVTVIQCAFDYLASCCGTCKTWVFAIIVSDRDHPRIDLVGKLQGEDWNQHISSSVCRQES